MIGFKRASRRQAAIVGLAVLMGTSFLGCHSGPKLFSKKDRGERTAMKELAEKDQDKGKFVNRKKVRPESDYRDDAEEGFAKSDSKSKTRPNDSTNKSKNERATATRQRPNDAVGSQSLSAKSTASSPKTSKSTDRTEIARRDTNKQSLDDLLNGDSLFDDRITEPSKPAKKTTSNSSSLTKSTTSKSKVLDEDPFKDSDLVLGAKTAKRQDKTIATTNFFEDDELDDELDDEADELDELRAPAVKKAVAKTVVPKESPNHRMPQQPTASKQKFLEEVDVPAADSFRSLLRDAVSEESAGDEIVLPDVQPVKRAANTTKTVAGQKVIDRRKEVQQTIDGWRAEMNHGESLADVEKNAELPEPPSSPRASNSSATKGQQSTPNIDSFTAPTKSQGAVLNGELIIDTNNLPSRFQRPAGTPPATEPSNSKGVTGRVNQASDANIDIVPGSTQFRSRPAGQISLQSAEVEEVATGLTTAGFEQTSEHSDLSKLTSMKSEVDSEFGPKLSALDEEEGIAPAPPEETPDSSTGLEDSPSGSSIWKWTLLISAAMVSAMVIGFGLKRRMDPVFQPVRIPKPPRIRPSDPVA